MAECRFCAQGAGTGTLVSYTMLQSFKIHHEIMYLVHKVKYSCNLKFILYAKKQNRQAVNLTLFIMC
ncbi:hypothetical protein BDA96_01G115900 [Sorghum bicolor]|uniref:Uncharacterized protein n=1 Tax=Sorghum bicolor TaxID=4558 RepID=A0A921RWR5_SORBI|nr:hypothetical protein BDA96_01G115900 [Sorghum bicolor]